MKVGWKKDFIHLRSYQVEKVGWKKECNVDLVRALLRLGPSATTKDQSQIYISFWEIKRRRKCSKQNLKVIW